MTNDDPYWVLQVEKTASQDEIKKAYRKLASKWHPDRNPDNPQVAEAQFKRVAAAWAILGDPEKRRLYDRYGHSGAEDKGTYVPSPVAAEFFRQQGPASSFKTSDFLDPFAPPEDLKPLFQEPSLFDSFFGANNDQPIAPKRHTVRKWKNRGGQVSPKSASSATPSTSNSSLHPTAHPTKSSSPDTASIPTSTLEPSQLPSSSSATDATISSSIDHECSEIDINNPHPQDLDSVPSLQSLKPPPKESPPTTVSTGPSAPSATAPTIWGIRISAAPQDTHGTLPITLKQLAEGYFWQGQMEQIVILRKGDRLSKPFDVSFKIPPSASLDTQVRIHGKGNYTQGDQPGDLVLKLQLVPHQVYTLRGIDLHASVPLSLRHALRGTCRIFLPSLLTNEPFKVQITTSPNPILHGHVHIVGNKGLQDPRNPEVQGNLIVTFNVILPSICRLEKSRQTQLLELLKECEGPLPSHSESNDQ